MNIEKKEKIFWGVGIVLIIALIVILINLIVKWNTKNNHSDLIENSNSVVHQQEEKIYEILSDGSKSNVSKGVTDAKISLDGINFSNCSIVEKEGETYISLDVKNETVELIKDRYFIVKLYDKDDKLISEFNVLADNIQPNSTETIKTLMLEKCVDAKTLKIEWLNK